MFALVDARAHAHGLCTIAKVTIKCEPCTDSRVMSDPTTTFDGSAQFIDE